MVEVLCSKYIPKEIVVVKKENRDIEEYKLKGYDIKEISYNLYEVTKPQRLEMVFRKGERDYAFPSMMVDVYRYYGKRMVSDEQVSAFVHSIICGKIKISIFPNGTYTVRV